jgi:hypothetical protein
VAIFTPSTSVSIERGRWRLNGTLAYPGTRAEGRMTGSSGGEYPYQKCVRRACEAVVA